MHVDLTSRVKAKNQVYFLKSIDSYLRDNLVW